MKKLLLFLSVFCGLAAAQNPVIQFRTSDPAGACGSSPMWYNYTLGKMWGCKAGTWTLVAGTGAGATIASTSDLIAGDGAGNGIDSGILPIGGAGNGTVKGNFDQCMTNYPSGGTATLTVTSCRIQSTSGSSATTIKLPNATTLVDRGASFYVLNTSSNTITVQDATAATLVVIPALGGAQFSNSDFSTSAGVWHYRFYVPSSIPAHNVVGNNTGSAAAPTTVQLACADLSDAGAGCSGGAGITQLTGDVTAGPGSGSVATTIAKVSSISGGQVVAVDGSKNVIGLDHNSLNTASALAERDSSSNAFFNTVVGTVTSVTAAAGTTTLTKASSPDQVLTGTGGQTFTLPNATTLAQTGFWYRFHNNATGTLTLNMNGGSLLVSIPTLTAALVVNTANGTAAGSWDVRFLVPASAPAHQVMGNNTGSAAAPSMVRLACADLSDSASGCSSTAITPSNLYSYGLSWGGTWTDPTTAGFSTVHNLTGDQVNTGTGYEELIKQRGNVSGTNGTLMRTVNLPSTPYTIEACWTSNGATGGTNGIGLVLYDGTKMEWGAQSTTTSNTGSGMWSVATTSTTTMTVVNAGAAVPPSPVMCQKVTDDGTTRRWGWSTNLMRTWMTNVFLNEPHATTLTPTQAGYGVLTTDGNYYGEITILHWRIVTSVVAFPITN